jgi:hypothetical protein
MSKEDAGNGTPLRQIPSERLRKRLQIKMFCPSALM